MNVRDAIRMTNGRFFSMTFVRSSDTKSGKRGEVVKRVFRTGVKKGVKNIGLKFDPIQKGLVTLWCQDGYRMVKEDCILSIKVNGVTSNFKK